MPEQTSPFGDDFPCCTAPAARAELSREHLDVFTSDPHAAAESEVKAMAREVLAARARVAELTAALDESRGDAGWAHGQAGALLARVVELQAQVTARDARVAELEAQRDRVRELHQPIEALNMRHNPNGRLTRVCSGCGTDDGNWQHYPCPTIRALKEVDR